MGEGDLVGEHPEAGSDNPEFALTRRVSRRTFLGGVAGATALLYVRPNRLSRIAFPEGLPTVDGVPTLDTSLIDTEVSEAPDIVITAERDTDLVLLDFAFYGFTIEPGTPPTIVSTNPDNVVVVQFPPQAIAEGVYTWNFTTPYSLTSPGLPVDPPPILSDVSGPSQLCFNLSPSQTIPLPTMTVADLVDWSTWSLLVPANAQVPVVESNPPSQPGVFETAIEFPYALYLAPTVDVSGSGAFTTGFLSRSSPLVSPAGVIDLWSTSLVGTSSTSDDDGLPFVPQVSAVWTPDYVNTTDPVPVSPSATPETTINYVSIG
jgi:hypothetical protein